MKNKITKKAIAILMLLTTILSSLSNIVFAKSVGNDAYLENKGDCGYHVQYWDEAHRQMELYYMYLCNTYWSRKRIPSLLPRPWTSWGWRRT